MANTQYLQTKLAMDEGLTETWEYITSQLKAVDKAGIFRLALNTLAKKLKKEDSITQSIPSDKEILALLSEASSRKGGMSDSEFMDWWAKNERFLEQGI